MKISIKLRVFRDRLFERSHGGGGGGGGAVTRREGVGNSGVGAKARWGHWGDSGGQQCGCLQPLRIALHTISRFPKQFELKHVYHVYPAFEDEKSKSVRRKIDQAKNRKEDRKD